MPSPWHAGSSRPAVHTANPSVCTGIKRLRQRERQRQTGGKRGSSLLRALIPSEHSPTHTNSFNPKDLPKASSPNTITLGSGFPCVNLWGQMYSIQNVNCCEYAQRFLSFQGLLSRTKPKNFSRALCYLGSGHFYRNPL